MASAASRDSMSKPQMPLGPSPSPQTTRRRHKKKKVDPFEELSQAASPEPLPGQEEESILTKARRLPKDMHLNVKLTSQIILTPVLFISFIVSLFLVNHRNRARRRKAHTTYSSILSYLAPSSWLDPEPYQDPTDSTWGREGHPGHVGPHDAIGPPMQAAHDGDKQKTKKSWHLNKKIRRVAKLEINDAFEMRGRIIAVMLLMMVLGSVAMWMVSKWMYESMSNMMTSSAL
ncbi:hypothetical protein NX059_007428 [Plenodomus lindquistii]|nr:hypothetical protein NX059_007428 [Plenodomus lindquistii]